MTKDVDWSWKPQDSAKGKLRLRVFAHLDLHRIKYSKNADWVELCRLTTGLVPRNKGHACHQIQKFLDSGGTEADRQRVKEERRQRKIQRKKDRRTQKIAQARRERSNGYVRKRADKSKEFYASWEWKKARFEIIKKYGSTCMCCKSEHRIVVDHIKPRSKFPALELDLNNLQILCNDCNMGKSNDDYTDFRPDRENLLTPEEYAELEHLADTGHLH